MCFLRIVEKILLNYIRKNIHFNKAVTKGKLANFHFELCILDACSMLYINTKFTYMAMVKEERKGCNNILQFTYLCLCVGCSQKYSG